MPRAMVSYYETCLGELLLIYLCGVAENSNAVKSPAEAPTSGSPQPTSARPSGPRQSLAPQTIIPADADDDTKLAMYREKLKYYALGHTNGTSDEGPASS